MVGFSGVSKTGVSKLYLPWKGLQLALESEEACGVNAASRLYLPWKGLQRKERWPKKKVWWAAL